MRVTDNRQSLITRSPHSLSRHSIQSKSPPILSHSYSHTKPKAKPKPPHLQTDSSLLLSNPPLSKRTPTDTPQFSNDPSKYVYNCQQVYALLQSVKIQRNYQSSLQLIQVIKDTILKLGNKKSLEGEIDALLRVLGNIERKLGYRIHQQDDKGEQKDISKLTIKVQQKPTYKYNPRQILISKQRSPEMIPQHQIQFSLVSNWKQITGKQVIYTNFSLLEDDSIDLSNSQKMSSKREKQKEKENKSINMNSKRVDKYSMESNTSNVLMTDLNLEIQMLDALLEGKLKRKPKSVCTSISSETIKKTKTKKILF